MKLLVLVLAMMVLLCLARAQAQDDPTAQTEAPESGLSLSALDAAMDEDDESSIADALRAEIPQLLGFAGFFVLAFWSFFKKASR